jgi:hypothetical protein
VKNLRLRTLSNFTLERPGIPETSSFDFSPIIVKIENHTFSAGDRLARRSQVTRLKEVVGLEANENIGGRNVIDSVIL